MEITWLTTNSLSLLFLLFILISIFFFQRRRRRTTTTILHPQYLPPSPPAVPILGHLHLLKPPIHRQLETLSKTYGPIFSLRFGSRNVVVISSPAAVEECFTKNDVIFANRPSMLASKYLAYNNTSMGAAPYGEHWRNLRRLSALEIFSTNRLNMFAGIRRDEINILLRRMSRNSRDNFARVELRPMFAALTCNIIMRMVAGKRYYGEDVETEEAKHFRKIIREVFEVAGEHNPTEFLPSLRWIDFGVYEKKLTKMSREQDLIFQGLIDEIRGRDELNNNSLIHHLLSLQKSEPEYYTDDIIKGLAQVLIFAGTDTTATTLEWAISLLLNHPDVLEKAREELETHIEKDRLMEESDIPKLRYLQSIIYETFRLFPTAPLLIPHASSANCQIGGFYIPSDTMLFVNAWTIHRDPKLWEDATSFKPERFENGASDVYKLMPFGIGRRACPGAGLANRVLSLTLGSLIQSYEWKKVNEKEVNMVEGTGITMPKFEPLEAMCKARPIIQKIL